ncbi:FAD-binding protein [Eilatimonas milleporae]|uniref:FAD/FMN-containing dehydrogenase n=1 Tax=Eilatimonas milleporae TaxID=911205 RepID=A0A3M0CXN9_9PROT|nr:FAD-binding protein [Eilatimonas milleporae]RMB12389.1 FAD/FMN-containing dehydrogenase [Eilatimonas milleporae]
MPADTDTDPGLAPAGSERPETTEAPQSPDLSDTMDRRAALRRRAEAAGLLPLLDQSAETAALFRHDVFARAAHPPLGVFRVAARGDVQAVMRLAREAALDVEVRGGGLSYSGGYLPQTDRTVTLDMRGLDGITVDPAGRWVAVGAGVTWATLRDTLAGTGRRVALPAPVSGSVSTVGGAIRQGLPGNMDAVLAVEIVLADGRVLRTGGLACEQAPVFDGGAGAPQEETDISRSYWRGQGPDLTGLFIGDCGALGVLTEAWLALEPVPGHSEYVSAVFPDTAAFAAAFAAVSREGAGAGAGPGTGVRAYGMDPGRMAGAALPDGRERLRMGLSLLAAARGLGDLIRLAAMGVRAALSPRSVTAPAGWGLHLIVEAGSRGALRQASGRAAALMAAHGGTAIAAAIPAALDARPFSVRGMLGRAYERWVPAHGIFEPDRGPAVLPLLEAHLRERIAAHADKGFTAGFLIVGGSGAPMVIEPMILWPGRLNPLHLASVPKARAAAGHARHDQASGDEAPHGAAGDQTPGHRAAGLHAAGGDEASEQRITGHEAAMPHDRAAGDSPPEGQLSDSPISGSISDSRISGGQGPDGAVSESPMPQSPMSEDPAPQSATSGGVPMQKGAGQGASFQSASRRSGAFEDAAFRGEPSQNEPSQNEAPQNEAPQNEAPQSGASQSGASQSGASQSGASQSGASQNEAPQSGAFQGEAFQGAPLQRDSSRDPAPQGTQPQSGDPHGAARQSEAAHGAAGAAGAVGVGEAGDAGDDTGSDTGSDTGHDAVAGEIRDGLIRLIDSLGGQHVQLGRRYAYLERLGPAARALVTALKTAADPDGRLAPGTLGLAPRTAQTPDTFGTPGTPDIPDTPDTPDTHGTAGPAADTPRASDGDPERGAQTAKSLIVKSEQSDTPAAGISEADTPAAGTPAAGTPAADTPEAGISEAGTPEVDTPEAGTPEAGTPEAGTPEAGTPEAGTPKGGMVEGAGGTSGGEAATGAAPSSSGAAGAVASAEAAGAAGAGRGAA